MDPGTILATVTTSATVITLISRYYSGVKNAREDVKRFSASVEEIHSVLQKVQALASGPDAARLPASDLAVAAVEQSLREITELEDQLNPKMGGKMMRRVGLRALKWPFTSKQMDEYITRLERRKAMLNIALNADQTSLVIGIDTSVSHLREKEELAEQDRQLAKLAYAEGAAFDSSHRQYEPHCTPGTRLSLLKVLQEWTVNHGKCIFWLNGMAGTGKSTIARTFAHELFDQSRLGASFFFSRGTGDLGHAAKFVSTIACQLANVSPLIKKYISEAITQHGNVTRQGLRNQWKELILRPLARLSGQSTFTLTLVVDALDECEHEEDIGTLLQLFIEAKDITAVNLRVFVTSRPETPIRIGFRDMSEIIYQDLVLHDIPRSIVEHDICVYLTHELVKIRKERNLPSQWPNQDTTDLLIQKSSGLFIYIATACLFIRDKDWLPEEQLSIILQDDIVGDSPTSRLDNMYTQVLRYSVLRNKIGKERDRLSKRFKQIVGPIVILFDVLTSHELAKLLSTSESQVEVTLNSLHSVLNIPKDKQLPLRLLHPSFRDFLVNSQRCQDSDISINKYMVHEDLAQSCLLVMSKILKKNICALNIPGARLEELSDIQINSRIPKHVRYACCYWVDHVQLTSHDRRRELGLLEDGGPIHTFLEKHFLHWIEVLSLIGKTSEGVLMMTKLESMLQLNSFIGIALKDLVYDAKRFILKNRSMMMDTPLQLYVSALIFSPYQSVIRDQNSSHFPPWIKMLPQVGNNWSSVLQTLEGHSTAVRSAIFSPDGQQLASASQDGAVRLWDAKTGAALHTFEGISTASPFIAFSSDSQTLAFADWIHPVRLWNPKTGAVLKELQLEYKINSLTFSPDDRQLASASGKSVRLCGAKTGQALQILNGHAGEVTSVVFSPDGQQLASGSNDRTTRLWDIKTGATLQTMQEHSSIVNCVAFAPDKQLIASAASDKTVRLWDLGSGAVRTLEGHSDTVAFVAFSPDGQQLASASWDGTVRLWDFKTGKTLKILRGHFQLVSTVAFSPDSQQLASTSDDKTVILWEPKREQTVQPRHGHSARVHCIVFSPDGEQLASGSDDKTVRTWCPMTGAQLQTFKGHSKEITSIAFSSNGEQLVTSADDHTVRLWDVRTGTPLLEISCTATVVLAAFSLTGQQVATANDDKVVQLWDTSTGLPLHTFEGHVVSTRSAASSALLIKSLVFSADGRQLASGSQDKTARVWDTTTGAELQTLHHSDSIRSVSFSLDGKTLASASDDGHSVASHSANHTVWLWDTNLGQCLGVFDINGVIIELTFSADQGGFCAETNLGESHFISDLTLSREPARPSNAWWINGDWFTWGNQNIMWLPPEFRPFLFGFVPLCFARHGNFFALVDTSHRIVFFEFNSDFDPLK